MTPDDAQVAHALEALTAERRTHNGANGANSFAFAHAGLLRLTVVAPKPRRVWHSVCLFPQPAHQMEVDEATAFFAAMPVIAHPRQLLKDVGLSYLTLGQPSPTLNAGHSVVVIEHDLGPDGGNAGGKVVAAATPEAVVQQGTHTGVALAGVLAR